MTNQQSSSTGKSVSAAVIEAVAEEMGTDPKHLPETLHEVIDPDALDALFGGQNSSEGVVMISYCGYSVTVTASGEVSFENGPDDRTGNVPP